MSQQFINRNYELNFLKERIRSSIAEFIVIYGRRRVGKTALSLEFLKNRPGVFYLCSKEGDTENIRNFSIELSKLLNDDSFKDIVFRDWFTLFSTFINHINFQNKSDKLVIVIDEFPFLIYSNKEISSIFQRIWELLLKKSNIMLILLGSQVSVMESEVLNIKSPLYGRRTGQLLIPMLNFTEIKHFFPNYSIIELMQTWFILGGIPEYLLKFSQEKTVFENIKKNILNKGTYLYREPEVILNEELREPRNYFLILKSISLGSTTSGEISNNTGLDKSMVSKYLYVLENLKIIQGLLPVTASSKSRRQLYYIMDPYLNFWFKFVHRYRTDLEALRINEILKIIKKNFDSYSGHMFEKLVLHLIESKIMLENISFTRIGKWWHKDKEIDIVALNEDSKEILFCECKWSEKVNGEKTIKELLEKTPYVEWFNDERKESYCVFAKSFSRKITKFDNKKVYCFDLEDIEKLLE